METDPKGLQEWWQEFLPTITRNYLGPALRKFQGARPDATMTDSNAVAALLLRISRDVTMLQCLSEGLADAQQRSETLSVLVDDFLLRPSPSYDDEKMKELLGKLFREPADTSMGNPELPWPGQYL